MNRRAFLISSFLLGVMHATGIKPGRASGLYAISDDCKMAEIKGDIEVTWRGTIDYLKTAPFKLEGPQTVYWNGGSFKPEPGKLYELAGVSGNYASLPRQSAPHNGH